MRPDQNLKLYADPIPSFRFWSGRQNKFHSCKIETGFLCGDHARVIFFARVIQQLGFWAQKIQANVDYCYVRRRAERTSLGPGLEHPSLRSDSSLAAKRRAEALHVVFFFNKESKASEPSTRAAALCVYSRMIRSHERRALGVLLSLFSRFEPAPTDSYLYSGYGEACLLYTSPSPRDQRGSRMPSSA